MKCPSCAAQLTLPLPRCPECRLSLQKLDLKFGMVPRHSRYLSDRSGTLSLPEMEDLRNALRLFEKKFPQILFSVLVTELPPGGLASEYAFWIANRAGFSSLEKKHGDNFDILLLIDVASNTAALTVGYGLEPFVAEEDLKEVLNALVLPTQEGDLAKGIQACLQSLIKKLRQLSAAAKAPELENVEA